jgi:hypothetical protein
MPNKYDPTLDVATFKETKEFGDSRFTVGVFSYNGGTKKLGISKETQTQDGEWRFGKLGRMTKEQAQEIIPIMARAVETM